MSDHDEFEKLVEAQKRGEEIAMDRPSSSAELDTRRSKSALSSSILTGGADDASQPVAPHDAIPTGEHVDIVYGDGDEGAIYVGPVTATPHMADVTLGPGDVLYGDQDQGVIAQGPGNRARPQRVHRTGRLIHRRRRGRDTGRPVGFRRTHLHYVRGTGCWPSARCREPRRRRATDG
jgi:hypothetical protein